MKRQLLLPLRLLFVVVIVAVLHLVLIEQN